MKFGSCSENGNFAIIATTSGIYYKISLLPVLSQINTYTVAYFVKVKIFDFQTHFTVSSGFFALLTPARDAVKVENRSGLIIFVHRAETDSFPS